MKRVLVFLGTLAFVWGALLLSFSFSGLTGFAISSDNSGIYSVFGLSLIIGGLILVFTGARGETAGTLEQKVSVTAVQRKAAKEIEQIKESGAIKGYAYLDSLARKMGYIVLREGGYRKVFDGKEFVVSMPAHDSAVTKGSYRRAVKALYEHSNSLRDSSR